MQNLGWDDNAEKEFLKALRQPLINQTPLQVLVESLFVRIQSQSKVLSDVTEKVERVLRNDIQAEELLGRIRLLEETVEGLRETKLSMGQQQDLFRRLEDVEKLSARTNVVAIALKEEHVPDVNARLGRVEQKLAGTFNLNGRLMAVDEMAAVLGVGIPNLEFAGSRTTTPAVAPSPAVAAAAAAAVSAAAAARMTGRPGSSTVTPRSGSPRVGGMENSATSAVLEELVAQLEARREENNKMSTSMDELGSSIKALEKTVEDAKTAQKQQMHELHAVLSSRHSSLQSEVEMLRKEANRPPDISFADLARLESQMKAAGEQMASSSHAMEELSKTEIPKMKSTLADLQRIIAGVSAPREMDTFFHNKITGLEQEIFKITDEGEGLRARITEALRTSLNGLVRESDLEPLLTAVAAKASSTDLRHLARQLAELTKHVNDMTEIVYTPGSAGSRPGAVDESFGVVITPERHRPKSMAGMLPMAVSISGSTFLPPVLTSVGSGKQHSVASSNGIRGSQTLTPTAVTPPTESAANSEGLQDRPNGMKPARVGASISPGKKPPPPGARVPVFLG